MFVTLTPNPALDRVLSLRQPLTPQKLHRVTDVREQAGGKGVNVSRVLRALGAEVTNAAVVGGFNGQKFAHLLKTEGLPGLLEFAPEGETRECQIVTAPGGPPTEVYEPGLPYDAQSLKRLLERLPPATRIISGSLPPQCSQSDFAALLRDWTPYAVDTSGPALKTALECRVGLVKPNQGELAAIANGSDWQTAQDIHAQYGTTLLVTRGAEGAWLVGDGVWEAVPPTLHVENPVGAGDSTLAGFLWAEKQGWLPHEALRWAIASGSVCAALGGPQHLSHQAVAEMLPQVSCRPVQG